MQHTLALLALAASAIAKPMPQGVTAAIPAPGDAPSGCSVSHSGTFAITVQNVSSSSTKRSLEERQKSGILTLSLEDGTLKDQAGRTGYIAANYQFQFDEPPQTGAIYTTGFSLCSNNSLALGGTAVWYQCLSGGFYNLYSKDWAPQCNAVYLNALLAGGTATATSAAAGEKSEGQPTATTAISEQTDGQPAVTQISDGQPQGPTGVMPMLTEASDGQPAVTPVPVSQISDGQPQASTGAAVSQISDGQPQATTGAVSEAPEGQPQATTAAPVSQISDGQPQASTGAPVSQISDGQPQAATSAAPVSEAPEGQPEATTAAPVSEASEGQPQATTAAPISQISDGQPQAPTGAPVSEAPEGQPEATTAAPAASGSPAPAANGTVTTAAPTQEFTGAAAPVRLGLGQEILGAAVGIMGAVALL